MSTPTIEPCYAGFWRRLTAGLIDLLLFLPVTYGLYLVDGLSRPAAVAAAVLGQASFYLYVLPMTYHFGGTLGKLAAGVRVRAADGGHLTWRHVWRRSAIDFASSVLLVIGTVVGLARIPFETYSAAGWAARSTLVEQSVPWSRVATDVYMVWLASEFVVILLNRRRRALHDFIAGTVVVVTRPPVAAREEPPVGHPAPET